MHVGGGASGGDAHQGITGLEATGDQVIAAGIAEILQTLGTAQQGRCPAGQHPLHQFRGAAEGGGTLRCIQNTEPPGGAGTEVKQAAPVGQPLADGIDRIRQGRRRGGHGLLGPAILIAEQRHQVGGAEGIQLAAAGVGLFGEQVAPLHLAQAAVHSNPSRRRRKSSSSVLSLLMGSGSPCSRQEVTSIFRSGGAISSRSSGVWGRKPAGTKRAS